MKLERSLLRRGLIRAAYLLPAIAWLCVLVYACIPHVYFIYDDTAQDTLGLMGLMGNCWETCIGFFDGTAKGTPADLMFSYTVIFFVILTWISILWCGMFSLSCAGFSHYAFGKKPTDKYANRAKKLFHIVCPNRVCYTLFSLFLTLPAFFPLILIRLYDRQLGFSVQLYTFGVIDWIPAVILTALCLGSFWGTAVWQDVYHLDMFRLYKGKGESQPPQE